MKRFISLLLIASMALSLSACKLFHFHSYNAATCTEPRTCTGCGKTEGEALGHAYSVLSTAATCTEGGRHVHTCARCGDSFIDNETEALGHKEGEWVSETEATCQNEGTKKCYCATCGELLSTETVPPTDHFDEYGKCKFCGKVLDNFKALTCYVKNNSRYNKDTKEHYLYSETANGTVYIYTNEAAEALRFELIEAKDGNRTVTALQFEKDSTSHKVSLSLTPLDSTAESTAEETAYGILDAKAFNHPTEPTFSSFYPKFLRGFTDAYYSSPSLEALMSECAHELLTELSALLKTLSMGVTLSDLGFVNYA